MVLIGILNGLNFALSSIFQKINKKENGVNHINAQESYNIALLEEVEVLLIENNINHQDITENEMKLIKQIITEIINTRNENKKAELKKKLKKEINKYHGID